ncbi:MAG TPA: polysaccharide deacetylase family protein [Metabacillus sp.]|nr:polysaccharide deacetylase family protein [Metabacillus sp.]
MKATQFTVSDWIDGSWNITSSEILTVMQNGIDIENHSVTYPFLASLSIDEQYSEINYATINLKELTGKR